MQNLPTLLFEFEQQLAETPASISVSRFVHQVADEISDDWLLELIGVFAEFQFKQGRFDWHAEFKKEFPQLSERQIDEVLSVALDNFVSTYCPATDLLGPLPAEHDGFLIIKEIGRGATGVVYEASQKKLGRPVAVKVSFSVQCELEREASILARLDHPNVASVYHIGKIGHLPFIATELVDGEPLKRFCRSPSQLSPGRAVEILIQILDGIVACHARGIVHLDLNPSNIMLSGTVPTVIDFGIAKSFSNNLEWLAGTPSYMAPEILEADQVFTPVQCDVFSLGVVLYELLTGSKPYGKDLAALKQPPRRCTDFNADIDVELDQICRKAIAAEPEKRFQTAMEFQKALDHWLVAQNNTNASNANANNANANNANANNDSGIKKSKFMSATNLKIAKYIGLVLLACLSIGTIYLASFFFNSSDKPASPISGSLPESRLNVRCFRENIVDNDIFPLGPISNPYVVIRQGDYLVVEAELDAPAYCHLIAANPDGSVQFLYQTKDKVQNFSFPENGLFFKLNDGTGQQAFLVVSTPAPLRQWDRWKNAPPEDIPWSGKQTLPGVWQMNDQELTMIRPENVERGDVVLKSVKTPLTRLVQWLHSETDGKVVAILFPVKS